MQPLFQMPKQVSEHIFDSPPTWSIILPIEMKPFPEIGGIPCGKNIIS